jgi:hypothetical protein
MRSIGHWQSPKAQDLAAFPVHLESQKVKFRPQVQRLPNLSISTALKPVPTWDDNISVVALRTAGALLANDNPDTNPDRFRFQRAITSSHLLGADVLVPLGGE